MSTHGAVLPGGTGLGQDRWAATPNGVIVLDGATAIDPGTPPADQYVDALLVALRERLDSTSELTDVIADAIRAVTARLGLQPGGAPSSTVALLRARADAVDVGVLGDSTIVLGLRDGREVRLSDDRLASVGLQRRQQLRARLRTGAGYDSIHRQMLADIQGVERAARNTDDGYWIAEADHAAGHHAQLQTYALPDVRWAVLATDGAQRPLDHLAVPWSSVADRDDAELADLLQYLHRWEAAEDPDGRALPRSKPHDDKTLVTWANDTYVL